MQECLHAPSENFSPTSAGNNFYSRTLGQNAASYGPVVIDPFNSDVILECVSVSIQVNQLIKDSIINITKNGVVVYEMIIHTTDHGIKKFKPKIQYDEGDDMGYYFTDMSSYGTLVVTITYGLESVN